MSSFNRNNQHGEQQVQEDLPVYRSVMMGPLVPPPVARSLPPPPAKLSRAVPTFSSPAAFSKPSVALSQSTASWTIVEPVLLPAGHLLERTNVYVDDADPQTVADRICSCLREHSVAATTTNPDEEQNLLLAETQDCVKFAIRLFNDNGVVVVEIQRTTGCSFSFREVSRAVLRSAKGIRGMPPRKQFTIPSSLPPRPLQVQQECIQNDFHIAYNMLKSDRSDSRLLALDSLEKMTNSCHGVSIAATSVLSSDCLKHLISLLETHMDLAVSDLEGSVAPVLRRKILAVVANACAALTPSDLADILSANDHDLKARSFLDILLSFLSNAQGRPHDAYQAARCLQSLLISKEVEEAMTEMSAFEVVSSACNVGCRSHQALEMESRKLMNQLRNVRC